MERDKKYISKITGIITIVIILLLIADFLFYYKSTTNNSIVYMSKPSISQNITSAIKSNIIPPSNKIISVAIKMLYPTIENGRTWQDDWQNEFPITLASGQKDSSSPEFVARGNGTIEINNGVAHMKGDSPRMYVYDSSGVKMWNNVEVTVYAKRISESGEVSSQGIVIGARSEHQKATLENPCFGATYYGRLLYDGRAVFQKEVIHEGAYSINMPSENNKATWNTSDGTMPRNTWIGVKFIVHTNPDGK